LEGTLVCWRSAVPGKHLERAAYFMVDLMVDYLILLLSRSADPTFLIADKYKMQSSGLAT
jgi:hypothetical protein